MRSTLRDFGSWMNMDIRDGDMKEVWDPLYTVSEIHQALQQTDIRDAEARNGLRNRENGVRDQCR